MRSFLPECIHGCPGGNPDTCALCRIVAARAELVDVRALAAGDGAHRAA